LTGDFRRLGCLPSRASLNTALNCGGSMPTGPEHDKNLPNAILGPLKLSTGSF
jgi:hypothetical protein